jgi:hypothetical protein
MGRQRLSLLLGVGAGEGITDRTSAVPRPSHAVAATYALQRSSRSIELNSHYPCSPPGGGAHHLFGRASSHQVSAGQATCSDSGSGETGQLLLGTVASVQPWQDSLPLCKRLCTIGPVPGAGSRVGHPPTPSPPQPTRRASFDLGLKPQADFMRQLQGAPFTEPPLCQGAECCETDDYRTPYRVQVSRAAGAPAPGACAAAAAQLGPGGRGVWSPACRGRCAWQQQLRPLAAALPCPAPPQHVSQEQTHERGAKVTVFHLRLLARWGCEADDNPNGCCAAGVDSMLLDVDPSLMVSPAAGAASAPRLPPAPAPGALRYARPLHALPPCAPALPPLCCSPPSPAQPRARALAPGAGHARRLQREGQRVQAGRRRAEPDGPQPAPGRRACLWPQLHRHRGRLADRSVPGAVPGAAGGPVLGGDVRQRPGRAARQLLPPGRDAARGGGALAAAAVLRQRASAVRQHAGAAGGGAGRGWRAGALIQRWLCVPGTWRCPSTCGYGGRRWAGMASATGGTRGRCRALLQAGAWDPRAPRLPPASLPAQVYRSIYFSDFLYNGSHTLLTYSWFVAPGEDSLCGWRAVFSPTAAMGVKVLVQSADDREGSFAEIDLSSGELFWASPQVGTLALVGEPLPQPSRGPRRGLGRRCQARSCACRPLGAAGFWGPGGAVHPGWQGAALQLVPPSRGCATAAAQPSTPTHPPCAAAARLRRRRGPRSASPSQYPGTWSPCASSAPPAPCTPGSGKRSACC